MKKILKRTGLTLLFFGMLVTFVGALFVGNTLRTLPDIDTVFLNTYGSTTITDKHGNVIYKNSEKIVESSTLEELPKLYVDGLIAVEDDKFWKSHGVNPLALVHGLLGRRGGSTIEMQLIKNSYYNGGQGHSTIKRKIHEVFLANQINNNFSKEEILSFYINKLELGEGSVGAKAAMKVYFNKTPEQMNERTPDNIAQLAYIVGLGQAPTRYDLYLSDAGLERTETILFVWKNAGLISDEEYDKAKKVDLKSTLAERFHAQTTQTQLNATYKEYTDGVLNELFELGYDLSRTTLKVQTHMDTVLYDQIRDSVLSGEYLDDKQQIGVVVMDTNGVVVGMVGGRNGSEWNHATQQTRSSGSSMKPFTAYGPLLQYFGGTYNSASRFDSSNYVYPGTNFVMRNYGGTTYGMIDIQQALRWSLNTPVARIDDQILGSTRMKTFLNGLGLDVKDTYSAGDGIGLNVSPLQSAAAYNAINNKGIYVRPRFVDTIKFVDGTERKVEPVQRRAMNESVAFVLAQMLRGVPQPLSMGSAPSARIPEFQGYAGKTGSVAFEQGVNFNYTYGPGGSDTWYSSITNGGYAVSVWMGYDSPNTDPQIPDAFKGQQTIGKNLQLLLNSGRKVPNWDVPAGVQRIGGYDLSAHYSVTDSADIDNNLSLVVPDIVEIPNIKHLRPELSVDTKWYSKIPQIEKDNYKKYQNNPEDYENDGVITDDVYRSIRGR